MNLLTEGLINIRIDFKPSKIIQQLQGLEWLLDKIFVLDPDVPGNQLGNGYIRRQNQILALQEGWFVLGSGYGRH